MPKIKTRIIQTIKIFFFEFIKNPPFNCFLISPCLKQRHVKNNYLRLSKVIVYIYIKQYIKRLCFKKNVFKHSKNKKFNYTMFS